MRAFAERLNGEGNTILNVGMDWGPRLIEKEKENWAPALIWSAWIQMQHVHSLMLLLQALKLLCSGILLQP